MREDQLLDRSIGIERLNETTQNASLARSDASLQRHGFFAENREHYGYGCHSQAGYMMLYEEASTPEGAAELARLMAVPSLTGATVRGTLGLGGLPALTGGPSLTGLLGLDKCPCGPDDWEELNDKQGAPVVAADAWIDRVTQEMIADAKGKPLRFDVREAARARCDEKLRLFLAPGGRVADLYNAADANLEATARAIDPEDTASNFTQGHRGRAAGMIGHQIQRLRDRRAKLQRERAEDRAAEKELRDYFRTWNAEAAKKILGAIASGKPQAHGWWSTMARELQSGAIKAPVATLLPTICNRCHGGHATADCKEPLMVKDAGAI